MGWGTEFNTSIYISREILDTKDNAESYKEHLIEEIREADKLLLMLVASSPKEITEDGDDPLYNVKLKATECLEQIKHNIFNLTLVNMLLEKFEEDGFKPKIV